MHIRQFRNGPDNLGYLVYSGKIGLTIDGGAVSDILSFAQSGGVEIKVITHTHSHPDHTVGANELAGKTKAEIRDHQAIAQKGGISLGDEYLKAFPTPGHTMDSVCFYTGSALLTGDTLFNGTVGNCFSGDLMAFFSSIKVLMQYPPETLVYAGHDYLAESLAYARTLEPDNPAFDWFMKEKYDPGHVFSTLEDELQINPFLRFNDPAIIEMLKQKGFAWETEYERWVSLME